MFRYDDISKYYIHYSSVKQTNFILELSKFYIDINMCDSRPFCYYIVPPKWVIPLTLTVWILFLYGFWRIGDPFPLLSVSHGVFTIEQVYTVKKERFKINRSVLFAKEILQV